MLQSSTAVNFKDEIISDDHHYEERGSTERRQNHGLEDGAIFIRGYQRMPNQTSGFKKLAIKNIQNKESGKYIYFQKV